MSLTAARSGEVAPGTGPGSATAPPTDTAQAHPAPTGAEAGTRPRVVVQRRHPARWITAAVIVFVLAQFVWSLFTNPRYEWDVFGQYFLAPAIVKGLGLSLLLTVLGTVLSFILGAGLAVLRLSPSPLLSGPAWLYVWFFRSVPLVVLILVFYNLGYLYPKLGLGTPFTADHWLVEFDTTLTITAFAAALIGITLHESAYASEIIRAGILSVDAGQLEASAALGLPARVRFFRIVLPQAARSILPNAVNLVIGLVKGTSVVFIVALPEIFYTVQVIYNRNGKVIPLLLVACVWYAIVTTALSIAQYYVERHFARGTTRQLPATPVQRLRGWVREAWARLGEEQGTTPAARQGASGTAAAGPAGAAWTDTDAGTDAGVEAARSLGSETPGVTR